MDEVNGTPFGRYRLIELLGRGGMGEVWRAHDTATDRVVAIKVLPANLSEDEDFQRRFRREAHAAARLDTPHVVPIYDYGEIDSRLFVSMRLIKGRDLATVLDDGPLDPARVVRIVDQVAEALHAAHDIGLIHRDIKPANILLDDRDFAYLIDFGIARATDETRMTKIGSTIGTFAYIAPERLDGRAEEDARTDIYSLACVLYEALTGEPPFAGSTTTQLMYAHAHAPPPRPSATQPGVPAQFDAVIAKGMAKNPDQRYATTIELANAAHDAITVPIPRPEPSPPPEPPTAPSPVPTAPPTIAAQHQTPPPGNAYASAPTQQGPPVEVPTQRREPLAEPLSPPTPPSRPWWRRKPVVISAAVVVTVVAMVATVTLFTTGNRSPSQTGRPAPRQATLPFTGLNNPDGVAVDSKGTVYVVDSGNYRVVALASGSAAQTVLPFTFLGAENGVAVDNKGTVYVVKYTGQVVALPAGSTAQTVLPFTDLTAARGVAVDSNGTVYVTSGGDPFPSRVVALPAGSTAQTALPFTGLNNPDGVAVDSKGTVYVIEPGNNRVLALAAGSSTQTVLPFADLQNPRSVAVDSAGNLYVTDYLNRVVKLAAGSNTTVELPFNGLNGPTGVAVDSAGNVYVTDTKNNRVLKLPVQ
jgi:serine/threonine-protein kinase